MLVARLKWNDAKESRASVKRANQPARLKRVTRAVCALTTVTDLPLPGTVAYLTFRCTHAANVCRCTYLRVRRCSGSIREILFPRPWIFDCQDSNFELTTSSGERNVSKMNKCVYFPSCCARRKHRRKKTVYCSRK